MRYDKLRDKFLWLDLPRDLESLNMIYGHYHIQQSCNQVYCKLMYDTAQVVYSAPKVWCAMILEIHRLIWFFKNILCVEEQLIYCQNISQEI